MVRQVRRPRQQQNPLGLCLERSVLDVENRREEQALIASPLGGTSGFAWINPTGFREHPEASPFPWDVVWQGRHCFHFIPAPLVVGFSSLSHVAGLAALGSLLPSPKLW